MNALAVASAYALALASLVYTPYIIETVQTTMMLLNMYINLICLYYHTIYLSARVQVEVFQFVQIHNLLDI